MLLGMLDHGWFQPSQQDIENSTHIFTPDALQGWCFGGGIGMDCKGRFPFADRIFQSYTNVSEDIKTRKERSEVSKSHASFHIHLESAGVYKERHRNCLYLDLR